MVCVVPLKLAFFLTVCEFGSRRSRWGHYLNILSVIIWCCEGPVRCPCPLPRWTADPETQNGWCDEMIREKQRMKRADSTVRNTQRHNSLTHSRHSTHPNPNRISTFPLITDSKCIVISHRLKVHFHSLLIKITFSLSPIKSTFSLLTIKSTFSFVTD